MDEVRRYTYQVEWSDENDGFLAKAVEFPYITGFGKTESKALKSAHEMIRMAITDMKSKGRDKK